MTSSSSSSPEISAASTVVDTHDRFSYKHATHDEVLEDLSSRFILNLPDEELASLERICFQVEQAHWFYEDFIREENPKFPSLPLKKFSAMLFHACPLLHQWSHDHEQAFNTFMQYKIRVPVCGAIMLNDTWEKCLLVKGWKASSGWGFPKGKINQDEPEPTCAIREVLEETGYNLAGQINPHDVIEMSIKEQKISLYIVPGVPEEYPFKTKTRKEISKIEWFKLTDLPTWKRSKASFGKFYLISPFIGALKAFINMRKPRSAARRALKTRNGQPSQRKENIGVFPQSYTMDHDHTQESSSQSSSADPQTPSPRYLESVATRVDGLSIAEDRDSEVIAMESLDPHFARLLNSLTLSASAMNSEGKPSPPSLAITTREPTPEPSTPIPTSALTTSSANSHPPVERIFQTDWSTSAPQCLMDRLSETVALSPASTKRSSIEISPMQTRHKMSPLFIQPYSNSASSLSCGTQARFESQPDTHSSASPTSSSVSPPRGLSSRRSSSTADISPYLTRSVEMPTSGKRLKQLALLESVADESSRMTPSLSQREGALSFGGRRPFVHTEPASTPTVQPNNNVIYSSGPGVGQLIPTATPFPAHDDVFRVRPETSYSQRGPNQGQFAAAAPNTRAPNANVVGLYPPASHIQGHYRTAVAAGFSRSSTYSSCAGAVTPAMLPGDGMRASNSAKLLSILNGNVTGGAAGLLFPLP